MATRVNFETMIGDDTINEFNKLNIKVESDNIDEMASVINNLKYSIDSYKENTNLGFFSRMFKSNIEIQANIMTSVLRFEQCILKGASTRAALEKQYTQITQIEESLNNLYQKFNCDIKLVDSMVEDKSIDPLDIDRLYRRKNDLLSAQMLAQTTAAQFKLSKSNISILLDKFNSIERILKPAVEHNQRLTKEVLKEANLL